METLRREIHPEVRIVDSSRGVVRYVASDETLDSYREIVRAKGWRFDLFKKNAPFVDSHDYGSLDKLVGRVTSYSVDARKGQLITEVQWAIDVPENTMAQLGWKMTVAGYLKAVSVGFRPVKYLTPDSPGDEWSRNLKELGIGPGTQVRTIYLEQQLLELSAVVIGANPNALLEAQKAGALKQADLDLLVQRGAKPAFQIPFPEVSPNSPDTMTLPGTKQAFLDKVRSLTNSAPQPSLRARFEDVWKAQRSDSDTDLERVLRRALGTLAERRAGDRVDHIEQILDADPLRRAVLNIIPRFYMKIALPAEHMEIVKAYGEAEAIGAGAIPAVFGDDLFDLLPKYGAFGSLHVQPIRNREGIFPITTAYPDAIFWTENMEVTGDVATAGTAVNGNCRQFVASIINCSRGLVDDAEADLSSYLLDILTQAHSKRLDLGCFMGTGAVDQTYGGITGIFLDATIPQFTAASGHTTLQSFTHTDFTNAMQAVDAATLQRPCRWWVSSALLPLLLRCKDDAGQPLVEFHPEAGGFFLLGFPITLVAVAPATNSAGQKVMAFGDPRSYVVPMREGFRFESSDHAKWTTLQRSFRMITRASGKLRSKDGFVILKTAAS